MKEKIMQILKSVKPGVDFENCDSLLEVLDSRAVVEVIAKISSEFDVEIGANDLLPENFETVDAIEELIARLEDE